MHKTIERLLLMSDQEVLGLNEQAAAGVKLQPERSQFSHLLRHFLERFFNHETASLDGEDRKSTRLNSSHSGESRMPSSA